MTEIDELAGWLDLLRQATRRKGEEDEQIKICRAKIEKALGESEIGTIGGMPVVSWKWVKSNRLDQTLAKQMLTREQLADCMTEVTMRRFVLVGLDD
jgi:hypothetical protein